MDNQRGINIEGYHDTFISLLTGIKNSLGSRGIDASDEFATLMVKLIALDPTSKFLIRQQMVQSELDRMQKIVVHRVLGMSEISRQTIEMQLHYKLNYYNRDDSIEVHREELEMKISSLMSELKAGIPKNIRHYDFWYAKLIGATIIEADLGPATEGSVIRETEGALKSIFPKEDINLLSTMTEKDREVELYHLMHIAIGIRIFTKETHQKTYGAFIDMLPETVPQKIDTTMELMSQMREENLQRLIKYTTLVQPYFLRNIIFKMGRREVRSEMVHVRQGLVMVHQILIYLKELTDDLNREKEISGQLIEVYRLIISNLNETIGSKNSVPSSSVHPKFVELCYAWHDLQNASVFVDSITQLVKFIMRLSESYLPEIDIIVERKLVGTRIPTEKEFFKFNNVKLPEDNYALAKRIDFRDDLNPLHMSFTGFCIHCLVKGVGLVVISNPQLGIFNWKNNNFLLSSAKAAMDFRRDPESFLKKAYAIARRWPELIYLLNIDMEVFDHSTISDADRSRKTTNVLISNDAEAQTELHPIPSRIVEHYTWNEWDLRRRGLILSKIHKCRTHGTQTHWQALMQNSETQTYGIKSKAAQTDKNVHTELGLNKFHIFGLRGAHCGVPPHAVEITPEDPMGLKCIVSTKIPDVVELEGGNPFKDSA